MEAGGEPNAGYAMHWNRKAVIVLLTFHKSKHRKSVYLSGQNSYLTSSFALLVPPMALFIPYVVICHESTGHKNDASECTLSNTYG